MGDMDPHVFTLDIFISEMAYLTHPKPGGIHEGDHGFGLDIVDRFDERSGFFLRRDIGEISVKLSHGELCGIPGFVKDIHRKETDLGDGTVDRAVRQTSGFFEMIKESPLVIVSYLGRILMKSIGDIVKISRDIGTIRLHGVSSQSAKRDHFFITF